MPTREVLEAVLGILNASAHWHRLPQYAPNYKTVPRRLQQWCEERAIDERASFIDATCASAKGGAAGVGNTRRGKGGKILAIVDRHGLPLSVSPHAANHHAVTLVHLSFDFYMLEAKLEPLIGGHVSDSGGLDAALKQDGVNLIAPHRSTRKLKTQNGRHLRRSQRRWRVERFFAWRHWTGRVLIRWNPTRPTSWVLFRSHPSPCCSNDFEIGSSLVQPNKRDRPN